ncbi:MAG: phosphodiesterase [Pseudomonadota bacterium]
MILAQISDLHIQSDRRLLRGRYDNAGSLETCIAQLNALKPDLVLATGDLVDTGLREEYALLRELLAPLAPPLYLLPGNHDNRAHVREFFPAHDYLPADQERLNYVIDHAELRIIMLDTLIPGRDEGGVGEAQLAWLEQQLVSAGGRPVVIALHHPPFPTGARFIGDFFCADGPELAAIVSRHPNVLRVLSGHLHRSIQVNYAGTIGSVCPSTAMTFRMSFAPQSPVFNTEPPAYHVHLFAPGHPMITHTALLPPSAHIAP